MSELDRLAALACWPTAPAITRIPSGRTNRNYRVDCGGRRFFARLGEDIAEHAIERSQEARVAIWAGEHGFGPTVRHAAPGVLVCDFLEGRPLTPAALGDRACLRNAALLLARLHAQEPPAGLRAFDLVSAGERYLAAGALPPLDEATLRRCRGALAAAPRLPSRSLVHGDLVPENIVEQGGRLWLVDWEYAGLGHPATDLALLAANASLADGAVAEVAAAHGGVEAASVRALQPAAAAREVLWTAAQMKRVDAGSPEAAELLRYLADCVARLERLT